jgi:hypothetical protein
MHSFVVSLQPPENLSDYYLVLFQFNYLLLYAFFEVLEMKRLLNQTQTELLVLYFPQKAESYRYLFTKFC